MPVNYLVQNLGQNFSTDEMPIRRDLRSKKWKKKEKNNNIYVAQIIHTNIRHRWTRTSAAHKFSSRDASQRLVRNKPPKIPTFCLPLRQTPVTHELMQTRPKIQQETATNSVIRDTIVRGMTPVIKIGRECRVNFSFRKKNWISNFVSHARFESELNERYE